MFRQLPFYLSNNSENFSRALSGAADLFNRHPLELVAYMEAYWEKATRPPQITPGQPPREPLGHPSHLSDEQSLPATRLPLRGEFLFGAPALAPVTGGILRWDHLIYAYMIENTRI